MSFGKKKKPEKPKVVATKSVFSDARDFGVSSDFGSALATHEKFNYTDPLTGKVKPQTRFTTTSALNPELGYIKDQATEGLSNNMGFLQMDPNQRIDYLNSGSDPLYNLLKEQTSRDLEKAMGRAAVNSQGMGTRNSTTAGATQAGILNDNIIRSNTNLLNALNFGNENARADAGLNMGTLSGLAGLLYPMTATANANQFAGLGQADAAAAATAAAQNAANLQYANAMNAYNQANAGGLGGILRGGIGLLGSIAGAPFTGGASLLGAPSALSSMFGGGLPSNSPLSSSSLASSLAPGLLNEFSMGIQ